MTENSDSHEFSPAEIVAMKYAYRQFLKENPGRFRDVKDKEHVARSVINSLEFIRSGPAKNATEVVALIMAEDD